MPCTVVNKNGNCSALAELCTLQVPSSLSVLLSDFVGESKQTFKNQSLTLTQTISQLRQQYISSNCVPQGKIAVFVKGVWSFKERIDG